MSYFHEHVRNGIFFNKSSQTAQTSLIDHEEQALKTVLTIAGFDPSSGAGVTADLLVFAAHGLFGSSAITSLTVQSTLGVAASHPVDADIVGHTLRFLEQDIPPAGIKIGMLATARTVEQVASYLTELRAQRRELLVVLDPVLRSSSGRELLDAAGVELLQSCLLPLVDWITPNLEELALLTTRPVNNREAMLEAACLLQQATGAHILAKGGHLAEHESPDDLLLTRTGERHWLSGQRVVTRATHGTGCALSSALLSRLVLGDTPRVAAEAAKRYLEGALRTAIPIGHGHGHGPMNHLWLLRSSER